MGYKPSPAISRGPKLRIFTFRQMILKEKLKYPIMWFLTVQNYELVSQISCALLRDNFVNLDSYLSVYDMKISISCDHRHPIDFASLRSVGFK